MQQHRDGRGESRAIAGHRDRTIRNVNFKLHPAVFALMHISRHLCYKGAEIDLLARDR